MVVPWLPWATQNATGNHVTTLNTWRGWRVIALTCTCFMRSEQILVGSNNNINCHFLIRPLENQAGKRSYDNFRKINNMLIFMLLYVGKYQETNSLQPVVYKGSCTINYCNCVSYYYTSNLCRFLSSQSVIHTSNWFCMPP